MECKLIEEELVSYHFGTAGGDLRAAIEGHLLSCARCLSAFIDLKRTIEIGPEAPRPSELMHRRLRLAVAAEIRGSGARKRWLVGGAAVAALALAVTGAVTTFRSRVEPNAPPSTSTLDEVDSARPTPTNLNFL